MLDVYLSLFAFSVFTMSNGTLEYIFGLFVYNLPISKLTDLWGDCAHSKSIYNFKENLRLNMYEIDTYNNKINKVTKMLN